MRARLSRAALHLLCPGKRLFVLNCDSKSVFRKEFYSFLKIINSHLEHAWWLHDGSGHPLDSRTLGELAFLQYVDETNNWFFQLLKRKLICTKYESAIFKTARSAAAAYPVHINQRHKYCVVNEFTREDCRLSILHRLTINYRISLTWLELLMWSARAVKDIASMPFQLE